MTVPLFIGCAMSIGSHAGAHHRGIDRQEQVASSAGRQQVAEHDPHRSVFGGRDDRSEILRVVHRVGLCSIRKERRNPRPVGELRPERDVLAERLIYWRLELDVLAEERALLQEWCSDARASARPRSRSSRRPGTSWYRPRRPGCAGRGCCSRSLRRWRPWSERRAPAGRPGTS